MKKITVAAGCLLLAALSYGQDTTMIYFDASWKETAKENAAYYRKKFKAGTDWGIIDYYLSGKVQSTGLYSDDSCNIQNGAFAWYSEDGNVNHTSHYKEGKINGPEIRYYNNGNKQLEGNYTMGQEEGEWVGYYQSGKVSGKAQYKEGKQIAGSFFNEDGTANRNIRVFNKPAEYPSGMKAMGPYLSTNLVYPEKAQKKNIQGTVIIQFIVTKEGNITDVSVAKPVDPLLDKEAMRVIKQMPQWVPAIMGGRYVQSYIKQPITFKFQ